MRGFLRRALVVFTVAGVLAGGAASSQAFTLVYPRPEVSVSPTSGLPTATFRVRGKEALLGGGSCPVGAPAPSIMFKFYWYKVTTNKVLLWTKTTNNCSSGKVDTGWSPNLTPPSGLNNPGTYIIQVAVFNPSTGAVLGPNYSNTTLYRVLAPKPSPLPSPRPSASPTCGQVGTAPCPSPTPTQCTVGTTGMVPPAPGSQDVGVMLALIAFGTLPIGGIVMFSSTAGWNRRRFNQLAALIGLTLVMLTASGCAAIVGQNSPSPSQSEPSPSPSPSPSPTC